MRTLLFSWIFFIFLIKHHSSQIFSECCCSSNDEYKSTKHLRKQRAKAPVKLPLWAHPVTPRPTIRRPQPTRYPTQHPTKRPTTIDMIINTNPDASFRGVKQIIKQREGIPVKEQTLTTVDDQVLPNGGTLREHEIKFDDVIHLHYRNGNKLKRVRITFYKQQPIRKRNQK